MHMDELWFPEFPAALRAIVSFNDVQFNTLHETVMGPEGFDVSVERCETLAKKLQAKLDVRELVTLFSSLQFLYQRSREWVSQNREVISALREFLFFSGLQGNLGDNPQRGYDRLSKLLAKNPALERRRKVKWLETGILETATSFASFVDLRPNYTDDRGEIQEFVPIVIFRVIAESDFGDDQSYAFQLTIDGVTKLRAAIEDVEKKLRNLEADKSIASRLQNKLGQSKEA